MVANAKEFVKPAMASAFVRAGMFHSSAVVERRPREDSGYGTSVAPGAEVPQEGVLALNNLRDNKGAVKKARVLNRGLLSVSRALFRYLFPQLDILFSEVYL